MIAKVNFPGFTASGSFYQDDVYILTMFAQAGSFDPDRPAALGELDGVGPAHAGGAARTGGIEALSDQLRRLLPQRLRHREG